MSRAKKTITRVAEKLKKASKAHADKLNFRVYKIKKR